MIKFDITKIVVGLLSSLIYIAPLQATASVPLNPLFIPPGSRFASDVTEAEFDRINNKIRDLYQSHFKAMNATLEIRSDWEDGTVNAFADYEYDTYIIETFGGFARHPMLTRDGYALLICHELGHHMGGAPTPPGSTWPSLEGQADYFATLKCLRRYFADEDNRSAIADQTIDPVAKEKCRVNFASETDQLICLRSSLAALSAARLLHSLDGRGRVPDFGTPDPSVVTRTETSHPIGQCRLDTFLAGMICPLSPVLEPDMRDPAMNVCLEGRDSIGFRPRCWYR
jgi:hypothetical protein